MIDRVIQFFRWLFGLRSSLPPKSPAVPTQPRLSANPPVPEPVIAEPPPKLYEGRRYDIDETHRRQAMRYLVRVVDGRTIEPSPEQLAVIFSDAAATQVIAGAGSGKSTTLVYRVLFLHKILRKPLSTITVITFTRKSRADFIDRLVAEAKRWDLPKPLSRKQAERVVRTFHSKALQAAQSIFENGVGFFEFLGKEERSEAPEADAQDESDSPDDDMSAAERDANVLDRYMNPADNEKQAELLEHVYSRCYDSDPEFAKAIGRLFDYTVSSPKWPQDDRYDNLIQYFKSMSRRDPAFCDHIEERWTKQGDWPLPGVVARRADGSRFALKVAGETFFANGYVQAIDTYVVLGYYENISNTAVGKRPNSFRPKFAVDDKRKALLVGCDSKIRFVKDKKDAEVFRQQLAVPRTPEGRKAPNLAIRLPGESKAQPVFCALYALGEFAQNLGLDPTTLDTTLTRLPAIEADAIYATSRFFGMFHRALEARGMKTFNQVFSMLAPGSEHIKRLSVSDLISFRHLLMDEFQDISPLLMNMILALQQRLAELDDISKPSVVAVGDDWQSIYGWRGSSPHFFLKFSDFFAGATKKPVLLEDNFRSSQLIIAGGESFMAPVARKSSKKGRAKNPAVMDLPFHQVSVDEFTTTNVSTVLATILTNLAPDEEVQLLAATHDELKPYRAIRHERLVPTTFHQSKGLEADYVILLGAPAYWGRNTLKNRLYQAAGFDQSFDQAQRDEAFRVAYVAATRAKKMCLWFAEPKRGNVVDAVPPDGTIRVSMAGRAVDPHVARNFQVLRRRSGAYPAGVAAGARPTAQT